MENATDFIECVIGYSFNDRHVAEEALQRVRNKRLAFLGDKAVALVLIESWYRSGKSCEDGCSQLQHYACNKEMVRQAKQKHINAAFQSDPSHPLSGPPSIHCAATDMEAIAGAVWIDSGRNFEAVKGVMKSLDIYLDQA
ncbi:hypothetical protein BDV34DRAFT_237094 [Aspergillus parasiticus]|uniref:RNase III domain-containing protein n=1 Tax=Aspergillus parasiticus TaxID=5067 RepID=A0A5N6DAT7_ASPPA|nr:hypothetical protein BDV34DRAFT_237094 [Aspergillus parasiticus]